MQPRITLVTLMKLALRPRASIARDTGLPVAPASPTAYNPQLEA